MNTQEVAAGRSATRSLLLIGAGVVALTIVAIVIILVAGRQPAESYAADAPQGVLQRYLAAFEEGDIERAHRYFSADVRGEMDLDAYERAADSYEAYASDASHAVFFDGTSGDGDRVVVQLTIEEIYGDGLNSSSYRSAREIRMVRESGQWLIDEPLVWLDPAPTEAHL
jgi:hypothetical protein